MTSFPRARNLSFAAKARPAARYRHAPAGVCGRHVDGRTTGGGTGRRRLGSRWVRRGDRRFVPSVTRTREAGPRYAGWRRPAARRDTSRSGSAGPPRWGRRESEEPSLLPDAVAGGGRKGRTLLAEEEPPVVCRAEGRRVLAECGYEVRRDGYSPDVLGRSVLEPAVVVGLPRVGPLLAERRTSPVEQSRSPALLGKAQWTWISAASSRSSTPSARA
jgi:hypothetical protein